MDAQIAIVFWFALAAGAVVVAFAAIRSAMRKSDVPYPSRPAAPLRSGRDHSEQIDEMRVTISYGYGSGASIKGSPATSESCWVPPGQEVTVQGRRIPLGMLYVGANLPKASSEYCVEPALINPAYPVDRKTFATGRTGLEYWPAYDRIPPANRATYLMWLERGRRDPNIDIGYVFLFFYGLERRALFDTATSVAARQEIPLIREEVVRLLSIYGANGSFKGYATGFLDLLMLRDGPPHWTGTTPPQAVRGYELPLALRVAVGQIATEGAALPADWALTWVESDPEVSRRTAARRCADELRSLFQRRYAQRYDGGIRLKPCKRTIRAEYRPASASFSDSVVAKSTLPDVTALVGPRRKLQQLFEECTDALDPLSRWLGRNPEGRDSLTVAALLPPDLLDARAPQAFMELERTVARTLGDEPCGLFDAAQLLDPWLPAEGGRISKKGMIEAARLLANAGFGMEPDVRFCGQRLATDDKVVVFRLADGEPETTSSNYAAAALLLHLAVVVSAADGQVSVDEEERLRRHLSDGLHLDPAERRRLAAHLHWLMVASPGLTRLKKRLDVLQRSQRESIGAFLVTVAWADGHIDPDEVRTLEKIYRLLGLAPGGVHDHIHSIRAAPPPADGPVTVIRGETRTGGFAIPPTRRQPAGMQAARTELDGDRIQKTLAETAAVSALLTAVFDDDADPVVDTPPAPTDEQLRGLDQAHTQLLRRLGRRASWTRDEYEQLATTLGVLPDGAIDALNEVAFDLCDAPLVEGADPLEVDPTVHEELCA